MTDLTLFREYEPFECGPDGYPRLWHAGAVILHDGDCPMTNGDPDTRSACVCDREPGGHEAIRDTLPGAVVAEGDGVKHVVRALAGHRCVRCLHPYRAGTGTWGVPEGQEPPPRDLLSLLEDGYDVCPQIKTRPPLWSRCDHLCAHGGPVRVWEGKRAAGERVYTTTGDDDTYPAGERAKLGYEVEAPWRILTVHHLNERKHDLRWWNLASLCQRCHLYIQRKVQMERVYPLEHTDWFKPYAAGWYAYAYLGESLTREETEARLDDLLALERMA